MDVAPKKDSLISVMTTAQDKAALQAIARREDLTVSSVARRIIREGLRRGGKPADAGVGNKETCVG